MFTTAAYKEISLQKFGGLFTQAPANNLPMGASPQNWDCEFLIAGVGTRPGLSNPVTLFTPSSPTGQIQYLKSSQVLGPLNLTLMQDSGGGLWQENLLSPGVFNRFYSPILNGARAISETVNQREYICLSDLTGGSDQPRQYDGTNLDRISQVGPGAGPTVAVSAPSYGIVSITEIYTAVSINSVSWGANINLYTAQPPSPNLYFLSAQSATNFTTNLHLNDLVYVSGVTTLGGQNPNGTYAVTSIGSYTDPHESNPRQYFGVTANVANADFARGTAGGTYQRTQALVQLSTPIPLQSAVIGASITIAGASVSQWNRTWLISQTPTEGQLSISATSLTTGAATYDYTLISGEAPGWQPTFDYPMAAQIVDPAGNVWQITTPGTSAASDVGYWGGATQVDGSATWTKQPGTTLVLATIFNTTNGNGIFNIQNQPITSATSTTFTVAIAQPDVAPAAEDGVGVTGSGTALIIDPGTVTLGTGNPGVNPIYGNATGGNVLVTNPVVAAGQRYAVLMNLTRNGSITPASPPVSFYTTAATGTLTFSNLPIGPPDVIARIVGITLANAGAGGPFFWIPNDVVLQGSATSLGVTQTFNKTVLDDNTGTTLGPINISDAVLSSATNISEMGNNLQQQRELAECVKPVLWAGRTFFLGERTKVDQFVNLTFDGGSISGLPAGWTVDPTLAADVSLVTSQIFGQSLQVTGMSGNLVVELYSASAGAWNIQIPLTSMGAMLSEFIVPFGNPLFQPVPADLILRVYSSGVGSTANLSQGAYTTQGLLAPIIQPNTAYSLRVTCAQSAPGTVVIDRMEVFPTEQPFYTTQVAVSYAENPEAVDGLTGVIDTSILTSQAETNHFVFLNKYFITTKSKTISPIQSASGEPSSWPVDEISNAVGSVGPLASDVGEEYTLVASDNGAYIFDGGNHIKFSQEIQQIWDYIYEPAKNTVWIRNDLKQQRILIGVPLPTPNQWLPNAPFNATPASPNVILMCSVLGMATGNAIGEGIAVYPSMFTGSLIFHDARRKWTIWSIGAACGSWIERPDGGEQIWFGQQGQIAELDPTNPTDYGDAIVSRYVTFGFGDALDRERLQLGQGRLLYPYSLINIDGSGSQNPSAGKFTLTMYPETLATPYAFTQPPFQLYNPALDDVNAPLSVTGNRAFVQIESDGAPGTVWALRRIDLAVDSDPRMRITGR